MPSENGVSWLVVAASFVSHLLLGMAVWSSGVFHEIFMRVFGGEGRSGEIAVISSILTGTMTSAGLVSGVLVTAIGEGPVEIVGCLLASFGLIISAFMGSPLYLCITFGGITGFGAGLAYVPAVSIIAKHFDRRLQVATGIAVCGLGAGCLAGPPFVRFLDDVYGWQGALILIGGLYLHGVVIGMVFKLPSGIHIPAAKPQTNPAIMPIKRKYINTLNLTLLKNKSYTCLVLNQTFYMLSYTGILVHFVTYATTLGYSEMKSAMLISVFGISNLLGRLILGLFAQSIKRHVTATEMYTAVQFLNLIFILFWPLAKSYVALSGFMTLFGLFSGGWATALGLALPEIIGPKLVAGGYSFIMVAEGVGSFTGPSVCGWLYDITQYYPSLFFLCGTSTALSVAVMVYPVIHGRRKDGSALNGHVEDIVLEVSGSESTKEPILTKEVSNNCALQT